MATIRSNVAEVAEAYGLKTISALARQACLNRKTVRRLWKRPTPPLVKFSTITKICHALGDVSVGELLIYHPNDEGTTTED
jgi:DNA-binding Xre family transcriptional regulator